ncbi:MAG: hypothetical protein AB8E82_05115 [Aureispira sp.]
MKATYQLSLYLIWFLLSITYPLQAKVVYNLPPQKIANKKLTKKKHKKWAYKKRYANKKYQPSKIKENAPSVGTVIGWLLLVWLLWWGIMSIPIILGLVFNLPWLWILGVVLGCLPLVLLLGVFLVVLFGSREPSPSEKKTNTI